MIDLRHREAECRQPALLVQHRGKLALHGAQLFFGHANFILPAAFSNDARRIFRIGTEGDHVARNTPHRSHKKIMQGKEDQHRGNAGDRQRQHQDIHRERPHRLAQGRFLENDLEEIAAHRRGPNHAHRVARLAGEQGIERVDDGPPPGNLPHVDVLRDRGRHIGRRKQSALIPHFHRHRASADALENLVRKAFGDHTAWRGIEHKRSRMCRRKPVVQPIQSKICDRRHINQNFRHHHEQNGEQQQLSGEADAQCSRRPLLRGNIAA